MQQKKAYNGGIRAFIFDLDGVLVDTARYHFQAWSRLAMTMDIDLTTKDNENLKGVGRMESLDYILSLRSLQLKHEEKQALMARKNAWYLDLINHMTKEEVLPGVTDFLGDARSMGIALAVGSGSKNAVTVLERTGLMPHFDTVRDGNHITRSKPDPEIFLKCCEALVIDPITAVVFEDAFTGIQAAQAAGCHAVGVGEPEALFNAELCIHGFLKLSVQDLIEKLNLKSEKAL